jgi:hypothetical protein
LPLTVTVPLMLAFVFELTSVKLEASKLELSMASEKVAVTAESVGTDVAPPIGEVEDTDGGAVSLSGDVESFAAEPLQATVNVVAATASSMHLSSCFIVFGLKGGWWDSRF